MAHCSQRRLRPSETPRSLMSGAQRDAILVATRSPKATTLTPNRPSVTIARVLAVTTTAQRRKKRVRSRIGQEGLSAYE